MEATYQVLLSLLSRALFGSYEVLPEELNWDALRQANIDHVILKGSSSAMSYPRPELRCAGDIDLLVVPFEPYGIPHGPAGDALRQYFQGAEKQTMNWEGLPVLPPALRAVLMLAHKLEHILSSGMGLRQLCDWAVFIRREMTPDLWKELNDILSRSGLLYFAKVITRICVDVLAFPADCASWCLGRMRA